MPFSLLVVKLIAKNKDNRRAKLNLPYSIALSQLTLDDEFCTDVAFFSFFFFSCALPCLDGIPVTQEDHRQDTKLLLLQLFNTAS